MIEKLDVYNKINSRNYLRFELNESNEKEYLDKLISVREAIREVEIKNNEAYEAKLLKLEGLKESLKEFYNFYQDVNDAEIDLEKEFDIYEEKYINPLKQLLIRKEKLQMQVVPYVTNGVLEKFKALFSYEGRAKLKIEKEFNKELKSVEKEIKELETIKSKNELEFSDKIGECYEKILENVDMNLVNQNSVISDEKILEFKSSLKISKNIAIKNKRVCLINNLSEYIEICSDFLQIADLNVEEHYKFKSTEYKIYLQDGYLDNDLYSFSKYIEITKSENDFVGKQASTKLIDGIQECIDELENIVNQENADGLKFA